MTGDRSGTTPDSSLEVFYPRGRIPLVHWRHFTGAKTAVLVLLLTAVLSFVTGLSTLSQDVVVLEGPLAAVLPDITGVVRFAGVVLSFVLGILAFGLHRRKRLAWYLSFLALPLAASLPLLTLQTTHVPVLIFGFVTMLLLALNRRQFDQVLDLTPLQIASLFSAVGVVVYGSVGSYVLRDQFVELETWSDSVYYVIVTIATVGYGDITPLTTEARWFSLSIILLGTGAFTVAIGSLIVPAIEKRMASAVGNMTPSDLRILEDHLLVLGYSDITESVLDEIADERDVVVVTDASEDAVELDDRDVSVVSADPTDEASLHDANIGAAGGVVVATRDDAQDVLAVLAARTANPNVRIVAAANEQHNIDKLEEVGANHVISPMAIGGRILGQSILEETTPESLFEMNDDESQS